MLNLVKKHFVIGLILGLITILILGIILFFVYLAIQKLTPSVPSAEKILKKEVIMAKIIMIVAPQNFRDEEYFTPKEILENNGVEITTASLTKEASSVAGKKITVDLLISEVKEKDFNAIIFVGGPGASIYFNNQEAQNLAKNFYENNKIVAAICIAPSILANAGILQGKNVTSFVSEKGNLQNKGANYTGETVTVDNNIITGRDPSAVKEFGESIVKALGE